MARPQRIASGGKVLYRVQIRRLTRGIEVDEYFKTKRAAEVFIREVENAIAEGKPIAQNVRSRETFADAVTEYLKDPDAFKTAKRQPLKPSAEKDRRNRIKWLQRECFGQIYLKRLTWAHIDEKLSEKARELTWSGATRYRYETTLSRFLEYCRRKRWIGANVLTGQDRLNTAGQRKRVITEGEWKALLSAADDVGGMLPMYLRLAWETGARKGELLKMRWVDVEPLDHPALGAALSILDAKNHEDRRLYITTATYRLLKSHEQQYRRETSLLVFPSRVRNGIFKVETPFWQARTLAGLDAPDEKHGEVLTLHHIRHTWATRLGEGGASLAQIMAAGGWRTAQMAMRYMKRKDAQSAEAAMLLVQS